MSVLDLRLLGWPEVRHGGEPIKFRSQKALALLAYLAVEGGMKSRSELVALLWPESNESKGRTSLRQTLTYLKRPLTDNGDPEKTPHLLIERNAVGCNFASEIETDFSSVKTAYSVAQDLMSQEPSYSGDWRRDGEHLESVTRLTAAVENYRGDFLQGLSINGSPAFDYWLEVEREAWRRRMDLIFDRLSSLRLKVSDFSKALVVSESWVKHSRLSESAYRRLMEARLMLGDRAGALEAYWSCKEILEAEVGAELSPDTQNLASRLQVNDLRQGSTPSARTEQYTAYNDESVLGASLVGRSEEFARLVSAYREACSQKPKVVVVSGEAGIGKTCLVEKFLFWAETQGADIIRGRAFGIEGTPYGTVVDLTRQRLEKERAPDDLLPDIWLSELSRLLPELLDRYPDLPPAASSETTARTGFLEALVQSVQAFSKLAPVIIVVDDLHRVDQYSLDAILYITQRSAELGLRLLLAVCLRPAEPSANISLENWMSSHGLPVECVQLEPLSEQDTQRVLHRIMSVDYGADTAEGYSSTPEWFGRWLFEETGGHPFFLVETIHELFKQNLLTLSGVTDSKKIVELKASGPDSLEGILPYKVSELIREKLDQLSSGARELLVTGAVLGHDFSFEDLCNISGAGEVECLTRLEEALNVKLIEESPRGTNRVSTGIYSFTHGKIREVIYAGVGSARLKLFHRRAFDLLKDSTAPPATITHHAIASGIPHEAFRYNVRVGDEAVESLDVNKATAYYLRAYNMLNDDTLRERLRSLLSTSEIGKLYLRTGKMEESLAEWEKARKMYREMLRYAKEEQNLEIERKALISLAGLSLWWELDLNGAQDLLGGVEDFSQDNEYGSSIEVNWSLLVVSILARDSQEALRLGREALDSSREMKLPEFTAFGLYMLANAHLFNGDWESAATHASEAAKSYTELAAEGEGPVTLLPGLPEYLPSDHRARTLMGQSLGTRAIAEIHSGRPYEAVASAREALSVSLETKSPETISSCLAGLSVALLEVGELGESLHAAEQSVMRRRSTNPFQLTPRLASFGAAQFFTVQLEEARDTFREALEVVDHRPHPMMVPILSMLCASCTEIGDLQAAREYAAEVALIRRRVPKYLFLADFTSYYETAVLLNSGDEALAREGVLRLGECVGRDLRYRIPYLVSSALLSRWDGYEEEAIERLVEALRLASEIDLPLQSSRLEILLGDFYEELGKSDRAEQAHLRSETILNKLADTIQDETLRARFLDTKRLLGNVLPRGSRGARWKPAVRRYDGDMARWIPAYRRSDTEPT